MKTVIMLDFRFCFSLSAQERKLNFKELSILGTLTMKITIFIEKKIISSQVDGGEEAHLGCIQAFIAIKEMRLAVIRSSMTSCSLK